MEIYICVHLAILFSTLFSIRGSLQLQKGIIIFIGLFIVLWGGLRWETGDDWAQYYDHFRNSKWTNIFTYDRYGNGRETLEPGFVFINAFFNELTGSFYIYNMAMVALVQYSYYCFSCFFYRSKPLLLYALIMVFMPNYFPVRAGISMAFVFLSFIFIYKQDIMKYTLMIACASLIHYQCLVLIPLFFIGKINIPFLFLSVIYFVIALVGYRFQELFTLLSVFIGGELGTKGQIYSENQSLNYLNSVYSFNYLGFILNFLFLCMYCYFRKIFKLYNSHIFNTLLYAFLINNAIYLCFSNGMGDMTRLAGLFYPAQSILLIWALSIFWGKPSLFEIKQKSCAKFKKYSLFAVFFYILYYIYRMPTNWSGYYFEETCLPYKTIFDFSNI